MDRNLKGALAALALTGAVSIIADRFELRAGSRQAVRACDAGWSLCRFKATGQSPADAHGCVWVDNPVPVNDPIFADPKKAGYYSVCSHAPAPTDEPADDDSACGQIWRVCYVATAEPGAGR